MPCTDAEAFAEQIRDRDWNRVLSPTLFTDQGLADLQAIIEAHGLDAVDEAVRVLLARSKVDRNIARGHVRRWAFFKPLCEQIAKEHAPCAE
jgi:hypothetical protein